MRDEMFPKRFNILLIDDSEEAAKLFEVSLRDVAPRATLYWVATGDEGIEALKRQGRFIDVLGFDIVLLDLNMPAQGGFEVLQRIRSDEAIAGTPVMVMSNSRSPTDIERAYRCGANSYIVKPVTLERNDEVVAAIAKYWLDIASVPGD